MGAGLCLYLLLAIWLGVGAKLFPPSIALLQHRPFVGSGSGQTNETRIPVLIVDVDGTLCNDDSGIEQQILDNFHDFALRRFGLDREECAQLFQYYGSAIRGIAEEMTGSRDVLVDYFNEVFPNIDMSRLRQQPAGTGRAHRALAAIRSPVVIASNSPMFHVQRVLSRIGLQAMPLAAVLTPERRGGYLKCEAGFWKPILDIYPKDKYQVTVVDDNPWNLNLCRALGMQVICITSWTGLDDALTAFLCNPHQPVPFVVDQHALLAAKTALLKESLNQDVLAKLLTELQATGKPTVKVLDLSAGHLPMLDVLLDKLPSIGVHRMEYIALETNQELYPIIRDQLKALGLQEVRDTGYLQHTLLQYEGTVNSVHVTVSITNMDFMDPAAPQKLRTLFASQLGQPDENSDGASVNSTRAHGLYPQFGHDLIVGAGISQRCQPSALMSQIIEYAAEQGGLLYLPSSFAGQTQLSHQRTDGYAFMDSKEGLFGGLRKLLFGNRPKPMKLTVAQISSIDKLIHDSQAVMGLYHNYLQQRGQEVSSEHLLDAIRNYGAALAMPAAPSNWHVSPSKHAYLWQSLLWYVAKGAALDAHKVHVDMADWFARVQRWSPMIELHVKHVDILATLPVTRQYVHSNHTAVYRHGLRPVGRNGEHMPTFDSSTGLVSMGYLSALPDSKEDSFVPRVEEREVNADELGCMFNNFTTLDQLAVARSSVSNGQTNDTAEPADLGINSTKHAEYVVESVRQTVTEPTGSLEEPTSPPVTNSSRVSAAGISQSPSLDTSAGYSATIEEDLQDDSIADSIKPSSEGASRCETDNKDSEVQSSQQCDAAAESRNPDEAAHNISQTAQAGEPASARGAHCSQPSGILASAGSNSLEHPERSCGSVSSCSVGDCADRSDNHRIVHPTSTGGLHRGSSVAETAAREARYAIGDSVAHEVHSMRDLSCPGELYKELRTMEGNIATGVAVPLSCPSCPIIADTTVLTPTPTVDPEQQTADMATAEETSREDVSVREALNDVKVEFNGTASDADVSLSSRSVEAELVSVLTAETVSACSLDPRPKLVPGVSSYSYLLLTGPRRLQVITATIPLLREGEVLVEAYCTATTSDELKIFRGQLDASPSVPSSRPVGVSYPTRYGHSLVGTVRAVAEGIPAEDRARFLNKRVFAFAPHGSAAIVKASDLILLDDQLSNADACFLPSVETAVLLMIHTQSFVGQRVCIVGQGLLGILTAATLKSCFPMVDLTVVDMSKDRLAICREYMVSLSIRDGLHFMQPTDAVEAFDTVIELTGRPDGFRYSMDHVCRGGKVIVASSIPEAAAAQLHGKGIKLITSHSGSWGQVKHLEARKLLPILQPYSKLLKIARNPFQTVADQDPQQKEAARGAAEDADSHMFFKNSLLRRYMRMKAEAEPFAHIRTAQQVAPATGQAVEVDMSSATAVHAAYESLSKGQVLAVILRNYEHE